VLDVFVTTYLVLDTDCLAISAVLDLSHLYLGQRSVLCVDSNVYLFTIIIVDRYCI
jgi:hypothetical protein